MTEQAKIDAKIKQALENPEEPVRRLLTALYESNNFVSRSDLEEAVGYGSGYIGSIKTKITRALAKVPGEPTYADYLFHLNGAGDLRLRPDLWNVVGEILGKREEIRVTGMKVTVASVSRTSVDHNSIVTFEVFGLVTQNKALEASVTVPGRSGNTRQVVEQACDVLLARLTSLTTSVESLKEDLSQWE